MVPRVATTMSVSDLVGTVKVRLNIGRNQYKVAPGLYCVGNPTVDSPVLMTANYKLSFDALRRELAGIDAWLLVLETRGINVWCAAGKGTLSTDEVVNRVRMVGLDRVVKHRELILPQLAATGVAAHKVIKGCGFKVVWGPIQAADLKKFLVDNKHADESMRRITFNLAERFVLIPVEIALVLKPFLWMLIALFLLSGIGPQFSFETLWQRGFIGASAGLAGIFSGAVLVPVFLAWLPGRAFALKGTWTGLAGGGLIAWLFRDLLIWPEVLALLGCAVAVSSYVAMNFTGATPFTSPTGVEKEMRLAIPLQVAAMVVAVVAWLGAPFLR